MNKNENFNPVIFTKKVNNKNKIIPLNLTINTIGHAKHFPPATKEWFNSVYAYNNNSIKNLSIADKTLHQLFKSYFNFYFSKVSKLKAFKSKPLAVRFKRLTMNKIFISKAELKHTSSKVVITLYVFNQEKLTISNKLKELRNSFFPFDKSLYDKNTKDSQNYFTLNEKFDLLNKKENFISWLSINVISILKVLGLEREIFSRLSKNHEKMINLSTRKYLLELIETLIDISINCWKNNFISKYYDNNYKIYLIKLNLEKEIKIIHYYKRLLSLNNYKFESLFLTKLTSLIRNIYNKEVQFNIVNLKTLYLNSDIFTEAVSLKIKNRKNKLIKILRSALHMVKLSKVNRIKDNYSYINPGKLWSNRVKNIKINPVFYKYDGKKNDNLNLILLDLFSNSLFINKSNNLEDKNNKSFNTTDRLLDFVLTNLKHKSISGARLEAKGRLTRRFTASRSVFKVRWKGGIKNIDSSYRGLSSIILRGHLRSNLQYSTINSKNRNGTFGLKGWISSK